MFLALLVAAHAQSLDCEAAQQAAIELAFEHAVPPGEFTCSVETERDSSILAQLQRVTFLDCDPRWRSWVAKGLAQRLERMWYLDEECDGPVATTLQVTPTGVKAEPRIPVSVSAPETGEVTWAGWVEFFASEPCNLVAEVGTDGTVTGITFGGDRQCLADDPMRERAVEALFQWRTNPRATAVSVPMGFQEPDHYRSYGLVPAEMLPTLVVKPKLPVHVTAFRPGYARASLWVGLDGTVKAVDFVEGHQALEPAVIAALSQWTFPRPKRAWTADLVLEGAGKAFYWSFLTEP